MYKGYEARPEFDESASIFYGEVLNTRDVITFQGNSVDELQKAFEDSVEDYLAYCAERGEAPEQPATEPYVVELNPGLKTQVFTAAKLEGKSPDEWVRHVVATASAVSLGSVPALSLPRADTDESQPAAHP